MISGPVPLPGRALARRLALGSIPLLLAAACQHPRAPAPAGPSADEEVMIGYGAVEKRNRTGSVSSLTEEEIGRVHFNRIEELLRGRVAGLDLTLLPSGEYSVRIRGTRTFSGHAEPLVVIDGVTSSSAGRALARIDPFDVRRVDVLKGAAATIYGARGANGVILITTKRGQ